MSTTANSERDPTASPPAPISAEEEAGLSELLAPLPGDPPGSERRIDAPHTLPGAAAVPFDDDAAVTRSRITLREDELLLQASQVAETLRRQLHDLERRERELERRVAEVTEQERQLAVRIREAEESLTVARQTLDGRERELNQKITTCEKLLADVKAQETALDIARRDLDEQRARMREELGRELAEKREALQAQQQQFAQEQGEFAAERERHRKEHDELLEAVEQHLAQEREKLRAELSAELERERQEFITVREQWNAEREAQLAEIHQERKLSDQALQQAQAELENLRRTQELEIEQKRQSVLAEQEEVARQLRQERAVFENRARFQEDHLQKLRAQIEADQKELRTAQQRSRVELEQRAMQLRLRAAQLDQHRKLLEDRELSLERERALLAKTRLSLAAEVQADKDRIVREQETWLQERDAQQAEIRRQQDMLALHAENLENRRARLDQLRTELEETHRQTLEMRMLVEEAWAQFTAAAGEPLAKERVERAREALSQHYRRLRENLAQERNDLLHSQALLQQQKDELRAERQKLGEWVTSRNEAFKAWQEQLERDAQALRDREAAWRAVRDQWMQEKMEAEQIIRDLLRQLGESDQDNSTAHPPHRIPDAA